MSEMLNITLNQAGLSVNARPDSAGYLSIETPAVSSYSATVEPQTLSINAMPDGAASCEIRPPIIGCFIGREIYSGPYVVTPSGQTQTLSTENRILTQDVVVNPIPNNYGLITWNGTVITVS